MAFKEYVVLPTLHPEQDASDDGKMMPMLGVDGHLRRGTSRMLVGRQIIGHLDQCQRAAGPHVPRDLAVRLSAEADPARLHRAEQ